MRAYLLTLAAAAALAAQDKPPAPAPALILQQSVCVDVKPDSVTEFETLIKTVLAPGAKKGGKGFEVWQVTRVGPSFRYVFVVNGMSFADLDQPPAWSKGLGPAATTAFQARLGKLVNSIDSTLVRIRPELSNWASGGKLNLVTVFMADLNPAKLREFEAVWKEEILPAHKKAGSLLVAQDAVLGGNMFAMQWVVPIDNFAQIGTGLPLQRVLGPEGFAKLQAKLSPMFFSLRREVWRLRGDLSAVLP
jgi:hypothetical protein